MTDDEALAALAALAGVPAELADEARAAAAEPTPLRAVTRARALRDRLGATPGMAAVLDHVAVAALAEPAPAGEAFTIARAVERRLGAPPPPVEAFLAMARRGALEAGALAAYVEGGGASAVELAVEIAARGTRPTVALWRALHGRGLGADALRAWITRTPEALASAPSALWPEAADVLTALGRADDAIARWIVGFFPAERGAVAAWCGVLTGATPWRVGAPPGFAQRLARLASRGGDLDLLDAARAVFVAPLSPTRGHDDWRRAVDDVVPSPDRTEQAGLLMPEVLERLLALGVPLVPLGDRARYRLDLYAWQPSAIDRVVAHAELGPVMVDAVTQLPAARIAELAARPDALGAATRGALAAQVSRVTTLGAFEAWRDRLDAMPSLAASLDAAVLLHGQLAAGVLDEWGWPALDELADRLGRDPTIQELTGAPPHAVVITADRVLVTDADHVIVDDARSVGPFRGARWVDGELLFVGSLFPGEEITLAGGTVGGRGRFLRRDEPDELGRHAASDGATVWTLSGEDAFVDTSGRSSTEHRHARRHDPATGAQLAIELPPPLVALMPSGARLWSRLSWLRPAPDGASPVGAAAGLAGFAVVIGDDGELACHGVDGRSWRGRIDGLTPRAVITFPERDGHYPVTWASFQNAVHTPDGRYLTPKAGLDARYWGGGPAILPIAFWPLLRARDLAGSRALRDATHAQAAAILDAAIAARDAGLDVTAPPPRDFAIDRMVGVMTSPAPPTPAAGWPAVDAAIVAALGLTHPRLIRGVARLAMVAAAHAVALDDLRARASTPSSSSVTDAAVRAIAPLIGHVRRYSEPPAGQVGAQVEAVAAHLAGGVATNAPAPPTALPWARVLAHLGEATWRLRAPGMPPPQRAAIAATLALLDAHGLLGRDDLRAQTLRFAHPPASDRLLADGARRWFVRAPTCEALTTSDGPPPNATLVDERAVGRFDVAVIRAELARPGVRGDVPDALAAATGLLPESAAALWAGVAAPELDGAPLAAIYEDAGACPDDVDALAAAWLRHVGPRAPIDPVLVHQLRVELADPRRRADRDLRTLLDPDAEPLLTRDTTWTAPAYPAFDSGRRAIFGWIPEGWARVADPTDDGRAFGGPALRHFTPLVSWAYLALPGGAPARAGAARLAALIDARLRNPALLITAAAVDLTSTRQPDDTIARLRALSDPALVVTFPDPPGEHTGAYLLVRPPSLDPARLAATLAAAGIALRRPRDPSPRATGVIDAIDWSEELATAARWRDPGFRALVDDLAAGLPDGAFAADPRVVAPARVAEVRLRHALDADAATLLLQLAALPDPSPARVTRWNRWTPELHDAAAATLEARGLVVRRAIAGHARTLYPATHDDTPVVTTTAARFAAAIPRP